jgi:hypothetical protein
MMRATAVRFWWCSSCCVGSPVVQWEQAGDGWTCPDCNANVPGPLDADDRAIQDPVPNRSSERPDLGLTP